MFVRHQVAEEDPSVSPHFPIGYDIVFQLLDQKRPRHSQQISRLLDLTYNSECFRCFLDTLTKAMKGVGNVEQLQEYATKLAPMGQMGLKMFQQFVEAGAAGAAKPTKPARKDD